MLNSCSYRYRYIIVMSYYQNSGLRSYPQDDLVLIPNNSSQYGESQHIAEKWNHFFLNGSNVDVDIESSSDSSKSAFHSCDSSSCSSTSLDGSSGAERPINKDNSPNLSPTGRDISLVSAFPKRKSDGLCQITLSNKPSSLQHFLNGQGFRSNNEMETSRLDDNEEIDHFDALPANISSRLNIEDFDRMERLKISNSENGMLKSVKGTVRGYKNMVRRYSASFNSKGHVIPPPGQALNEEDQEKIIIYTTSMTAVRATTEACAYVKKVFNNRGLPFEERDVFIHKEHQKEMQSRLGKGLSLPQVIIGGIHIGGLNEIEELNESGKILSLTAGFQRRYGAKDCERCGGKRFINCLSCGGSKTSRKHRINREICSLRCTVCNENGLVSCPDCSVEPIKE